MTAHLGQIVEGVLLVFAALFPIVNPLGGAPIFSRSPPTARVPSAPRSRGR
jgi:small neutral amino acid transporter SnatA (MarC family)